MLSIFNNKFINILISNVIMVIYYYSQIIQSSIFCETGILHCLGQEYMSYSWNDIYIIIDLEF